MANNQQGVAVTIKVSQRQVDELARELMGFKNGVPRAISGSINKLLPKGRTETVNALADVLAVKKKDIRYFPQNQEDIDKGEKKRERIFIIKSSPSKLEGFIRILTRRIGLVNFKHTVSRAKGVVFQIYKGGPQVRLRHAFRAVGASGNRHIFQRQMKGGKAVPRFPIESLRGPSLLTTYKDHPEIDTRIQDWLDTDLQKELDSQVSRLLKKPTKRR